MQSLDRQLLGGPVVIVAPHMDDEALACGGMIAKLPDKRATHIIYVTDGMKSPAPIIPGRDEITGDLSRVRMQESMAAMKLLGVPEANLHFLCLPEARVRDHVPQLRQLLRTKLHSLEPACIFVPFRYDRHPDHLAVNHVVVSELAQGNLEARLIEYFVYYRWRLMPKRDIRKYIRPRFLYKLDISDVAEKKRQALNCFESQTSIFYPWQTRPILTSRLLDEECQNPEYFLVEDGSFRGTNIFTGYRAWIRLVHRVEPVLQKWKYLTGALLKRMLKHGVR